MDSPRPSLQILRSRYEAQVRGDTPRPSTVAQLVTAWLLHVKETCAPRPNGRSSSFTNSRDATRPMVELYPDLMVEQFGAVQLQAVRLYMIDLNLGRLTINDRIARIRRLYRFAKARGWIEQVTVDALGIDGLRKGRSKAKEVAKKRAVPMESIKQVLRDPKLGRTIKDMVRVQLATGMRPAEVCYLKGKEIDTSEKLWVFEPEDWKMAHMELTRTVLMGPRAQLVLGRYMNDGYLFLTRRQGPYRVDSYRQEIARSCLRMRVEHWCPLQIRKRTASEAAKQGEITAQHVLGHADVKTTRKHYITSVHSPEAQRFAESHG